jgi:hypothetical protein
MVSTRSRASDTLFDWGALSVLRYLRAGLPACILTFFLAAGCSSQSTMAPAGSIVNSAPANVAGSMGPQPFHGDGEPLGVDPKFMPKTFDGIHVFQTFDGYVPWKDAKAHGVRYDMVWGAGVPGNWSQSNPSILNMWYIPMTTDGDQKNTLDWWLAFHPDWIVYKCDGVTPAWSQGLPQIPLDISNPDAVAWQIQTYATKAEAQGYSGMAADLVGFGNLNHACGVWMNGLWVQKFSGQSSDPAWTQAVQNWASYAHTYLHSLPRPLLLAANHVPTHASLGDPNEQAILANIDIDDDEAGFSNFGGGPASDAQFNSEVGWMRYTQSIGHAYMVTDRWKTASVTAAQLDWSIATYLMGKRGAASLDVVDSHGYGYEYYYPQYNASIGHACGKMYAAQGVYLRRYSGGLAIVNTKPGQSFTVNLPQAAYTSIEGGAVQSPVLVGGSTGMVLLKQIPGC